MVKEISLSKGKVSLVDDCDYEKVINHKWYFANGYARRTVKSKENGYSRNNRSQGMHRFILDAENGVMVDHIDGNGLNNCRSNLRIAKHKENQRNYNLSKSYETHTSKYKGVSWNKKDNRWRVMIRTDEGHKFIGNFKCEVEAAKAYNEAAVKYHGDFAKINNLGD